MGMIPRNSTLKIRVVIQALSTLLLNSYWRILLVFGLYQGPLKYVCFPVLNCYACPSAMVACPIGSIQHFLTLGVFPFYALGVLVLVGVLLGRATCGWLCPFGFLQEILYKIPTKKAQLPRWTRSIKYIILVLFVILLPLTLGVRINQDGTQSWSFSPDSVRQPWFCKLLCPAGTLEGGIPFVAVDSDVRTMLYDTGIQVTLQQAVYNLESESLEERQDAILALKKVAGEDFGYEPALPPLLQSESIGQWHTWLATHGSGFTKFKGWLFVWKVSILVVLIAVIISSKRFFCRVLCPLGAIFGIFNSFSGLKLNLKKKACVTCNLCRPVCPVDIKPQTDYDSPECIRCFDCTSCDAIRLTTILDENNTE